MDPDALLDGLDPSQREAVTSPAAPLCIIAGAGSGKTRVLTRRIAWRVANDDADPRRVLALTFTRKAAGELTTRLGALGMRDRVAAGTFHAVAYAQLRRRWADGGVAPPVLLDRKIGLMARCIGTPRPGGPEPAEVAAEVEWAKARLVTPETYEAEARRAGRRPAVDPAEVAAAFDRYEREKQRRRLVDFDDLLSLCARALESDEDFAATQRWRFRHLFVDEFQDVNPLQHRLLEAWRGGRPDLCVVGDPNQSIYSWNGADAGHLEHFLDRHPGAEVVRLDHSHRSTPQILAVAGAVLGGGAAVRPTRPDGPVPEITAFTTDRHEARGIARQLRDLHGPGVRWSTMAVLSRTNAQAALIADALTAAGIPCRQRGRLLHDVAGVADVVAALETGGRARPLSAALADLEPGPGVELVVQLGRELQAVDAAATVDTFVGWAATAAAGDVPGAWQRDAVDVLSFHAAKGLEWPVVLVAGLERGLVPIGHATTPPALAEERRLLYVALTRATRTLRCSWARERVFGGRSMARERSPFLDDLEAVTSALAAAGGPARPPTLPAATTHRAPEVLVALRSWRAAAARAAGVPANAVFHDRALEALASSRPADRQALVALPGIGPLRAARYGDDLLALLATAEAS